MFDTAGTLNGIKGVEIKDSKLQEATEGETRRLEQILKEEGLLR